MATYYCYKELKGNILKYHDVLYFGNIEYVVFLSNLGAIDFLNDYIFSLLGIEDKLKFCSEAYGYEAGFGAFPGYKDGDYGAATKVALALFALYEGKNLSSETHHKQTKDAIKDEEFNFSNIKPIKVKF